MHFVRLCNKNQYPRVRVQFSCHTKRQSKRDPSRLKDLRIFHRGVSPRLSNAYCPQTQSINVQCYRDGILETIYQLILLHVSKVYQRNFYTYVCLKQHTMYMYACNIHTMCCAVVASLGVWTGTDGNILSPFTLFSHIFSMPQACAKRYYYKYTWRFTFV